MSTVFLTLGALCMLGYVTLGLIAAPDRLSIFSKLVWLRENSKDQGFRRSRFSCLIAGIVFLLLSAAFGAANGRFEKFTEWLHAGILSLTLYDLLFAIGVPSVCIALHYFMDASERWSELSRKAKSRVVSLNVLKFLLLAPFLSLIAIPIMLLIRK